MRFPLSSMSFRGVLAGVVLGLAVLPAVAQDVPRVVVKLGEHEVTTVDLAAELQAMNPKLREQTLNTTGAVSRMAGTLLYWRVVAAEAEAAGVGSDALTAARLRAIRERMVGQLYLSGENSSVYPADKVEAIARTEYAANPARWKVPENVKGRHILVRSKTDDGNERTKEEMLERIAEIQAELAAGRSFEELAKKYSEDPGSADKGGDLGEVKRGRTVREFEEALYALANPGDISEPVLTQFGMHLIQLTERSGGTTPGFEEVRDAAMNAVRIRLLNEHRSAVADEIQKNPDLKVNLELIREFVASQQKK